MLRLKDPSLDARREFAVTHSVFRREEMERRLVPEGTSPRGLGAYLVREVRQRRLLRLRRGLYCATGPDGGPPPDLDPVVVAARSCPDGVIAYHSALDVHGVAHTPRREVQVMTSMHGRPFVFADATIRFVRPPRGVRAAEEAHLTQTLRRSGVEVRVSVPERTLVDCLDRVDLGGGAEEVWNSVTSYMAIDAGLVVEYVRRLRNRTTAARVGFVLSRCRERWNVKEEDLGELRRLRPAGPHYATARTGEGGRFVAEWNIIVPGLWFEDDGGQGA